MPEPILRVKALKKRFGGLLALSDVSFSVAEGEIYGVIGPNGAGKTTLFSCLVGSLPPTSGSIRFRGREIAGLPNHAVVKRGLVRTHQIVRPFRDMTVEANVSIGAHFGAGKRRGADARGRVAAILERTGLGARAGSLAMALPIGDLKRLEIARALATEPAVLCLDEVMGGLNPSEIVAAMSLIRAIRDSGLTVLMIEHHVHAVAGVTDRMLVLNFGEMIAEGVPRDVLQHPEVVTAYLGDDAGAA
ncbi:MAG: ABC transporter ATP-binding protein [Acidobacteriota bacterium]|nr:ABC transporter ATP-binding protein [Acidobacteriota bacterium]